MLEFQEKRKLRQFMYSKPVLIGLLLVIAVVGKSTWSVYQKARESAANLQEAQKQLQVVADRQSALQAQVERLSTKRGIEEEVRSKFQVAKKGEEVAVIVSVTPEASGTPAVEEQPGFWARVGAFFGF